MSKVIYNNRIFEIRSATLDDVVGIGEAHLKALIETYPNEEYSITKDWISKEWAFFVEDGQKEDGSDKGIPFRTKTIKNLNQNTLYEVVKDETGFVQGFMHAEKNDHEAHLNAIYLTNELKGTGVAQELIKHADAFMADLPVLVQVVSYNERAIRFYENNGFMRGETEKNWFHGKMPMLNMRRESKQS